MVIGGDSGTMGKIVEDFRTNATDYMSNYKRLDSILNELTSTGKLEGNPAEVLLKKFAEKKENFEKLYQLLDRYSNYMDSEKNSFNKLVDSLTSGMR